MKAIMQGDQYKIGFRFKQNDSYLTPTELSDVRIMVGDTVKTYSGLEVTNTDEWWYYPITQDETYGIAGNSVRVQVRIVFNTGDVIGKQIGKLRIVQSRDKEVVNV